LFHFLPLQILESWVVEAVEGVGEIRDPKARAQMITDTVGLLKVLPVDVEALRRTGIGRTFAKLSKTLSKGGSGELPPYVSVVCKDLVDQWKRLVEKAEAAKAAATPTAAAAGAVANGGGLVPAGDSGGASAQTSGQGGSTGHAIQRQGSFTSQPSPTAAASNQLLPSSSSLGAELPGQPVVGAPISAAATATLPPQSTSSQPGHDTSDGGTSMDLSR
jgi:hypothetical protein